MSSKVMLKHKGVILGYTEKVRVKLDKVFVVYRPDKKLIRGRSFAQLSSSKRYLAERVIATGEEVLKAVPRKSHSYRQLQIPQK